MRLTVAIFWGSDLDILEGSRRDLTFCVKLDWDEKRIGLVKAGLCLAAIWLLLLLR